ncbi:MAG: hypothetical protein JXA20_02570 [Spirochaetes bacterium]|nr:hypothetical protein [Spirochaetota bacterium]
MEKKFKIAVILMLIPVIINTVATAYVYQNRHETEFAGYLAGTILSFAFSIAWVIMARKVSLSNIMVLFTISLGSFPVKILFFAAFVFAGYLVFHMNQLFFGLSFMFGTVASLIVEVWFIISVNKLNIRQRRHNSNN